MNRDDLRTWAKRTDSGAISVLDGFLLVIVLLLLGVVSMIVIGGVVPPVVAVASESMEPNLERGDMVYVMDTERTQPEYAQRYEGESTGVVPADTAAKYGHTQFGEPGDVIVFHPDGQEQVTPIVHRAMFWVSEGEDWYDRADPAYVGNADNCQELNHCPAPNAGFITKGDNEQSNTVYDQSQSVTRPVQPTWIVGTAEARIPYLGHIRLVAMGQSPMIVDLSASFDERLSDHPGPESSETKRSAHS